MTITIAPSRSYDRLTPDNAVLLLIDHQIGPLWEMEFGEVRRRVTVLAKAAALLAVPTIFTTIAAERWGTVIPELRAAAPDAPIIERTHVNAWNDARVREAVIDTGRRKLIVAGSVTEVGVVLCARAAARAGFDVYAPLDASAQTSHRAVLTMIESGVIISSSCLIVSEMARDDHGRSRAPRRSFIPQYRAVVPRGLASAASKAVCNDARGIG